MMRRSLVVVTAGALILAAAIAWPTARRTRMRAKVDQAGSTSVINSGASAPTASYDQINTSLLSRDQIATEVKRRDSSDSKWEWKVPIRFFGRVVDEHDKPIAGAKVNVQWTDLTIRGASERQLFSDVNGMFQIHDVTGKRLIARVAKPGYAAWPSDSPRSFEFANPFDELYHRPDSAHPVTFRLRQLTERALLHGTAKARVDAPGDIVKVPLKLGASQVEVTVQAWKPWPPRPQSPAYDWRVVLATQNGGFIETGEEFPREAPNSGYSGSVEIAMTSALGNNWQVEVDKTYYFHTDQPNCYGVLQLRTSGNSRYVFLDYRVNPIARDRNVDFDPAKEIKAN